MNMCVIPARVMERCSSSLRDPAGDVERYNLYFSSGLVSDLPESDHQAIISELQKANSLIDNRLLVRIGNSVSCIFKRLPYIYFRGDDIDDIIRCLSIDILYLMQLRKWAADENKRSQDTNAPNCWPFSTTYQRFDLQFLVFPLLLLKDRATLQQCLQLFEPYEGVPSGQAEGFRSYYVDTLVKAFEPSWSVVKNKHTLPLRSRPGEWVEFMQGVFFALAQPSKEARERYLAQYMGKWNRMMAPYGWKPRRVFHPLMPDGSNSPDFPSDRLFVEFAFEAALAVCAYDLDDSSFRDHPYYPRDLVDHYRAHVRHTRDAWRAEGVGPGMEIQAPPPPPKLNLAKSKSKGLQRWLELVSDGDADATAAVLDQVGKLRKVKDVFPLSCALGENAAGLCADIKDDDTLVAQINALLEKRALEGWASDDLPPAGVDRCSAALLALDLYLSDKSYALHALGGEDDSWQGVVVARAYADEFVALSQALGIKLSEPAQAYDI